MITNRIRKTSAAGLRITLLEIYLQVIVLPREDRIIVKIDKMRRLKIIQTIHSRTKTSLAGHLTNCLPINGKNAGGVHVWPFFFPKPFFQQRSYFTRTYLRSAKRIEASIISIFSSAIKTFTGGIECSLVKLILELRRIFFPS